MRSVLKQGVALLVVLLVAGGLWLAFFPGAGHVLARLGFAAQTGAGEVSQAGGKPADGAQKPAAASAGAAAGGKGGAGGRGPRITTVVVKPAGTEILNSRVSALGTAAAQSAVTVMPKDSGQVTQVLIASGAKVKAGEVIATLDNQTQQIAFDKAQAANDDAQRSLVRNDALVKSQAVAESQSQAVQLAATMAELNLRTARQDLDDRSIIAPIDGVVGILDVTVGSEVTPQTVFARIEDASVLHVDFWLPERLSGAVALGDLAQMVAVSRPQDVLSGRVVALDNQIDTASGTFRVQAALDNSAGRLRPGMALTVSLDFPGESFVTVDPLSVQWGSDGAYVWRVKDNKVEKAQVRIVQRNTESVLVAGDLAAGDSVVTEGLDGLKAGAEVKIFGAPEPEAATANAAAPNPAAETSAPNHGGKPAAAAGN